MYDPGSDGFFTHTSRNIMRGRQVIVPGLTFNCYGRINHVSCVTTNVSQPGNDEPVIQLWRPSSSGSNVYNIIGQTRFFNKRLIKDTQFYFTNVKFKNGRVKFQPGDVIGYYQPSNPRHLLWSINEEGYISYSINASAAATTINTSNTHYIHNGLIPFVRVYIGEYDLRKWPMRCYSLCYIIICILHVQMFEYTCLCQIIGADQITTNLK